MFQKPYEEVTIEVLRDKLGLHHKEPFIEEGECEDQTSDEYITPPTSPPPPHLKSGTYLNVIISHSVFKAIKKYVLFMKNERKICYMS